MHKVMICMPGTSFSSKTITCVSNLLKYFYRQGIQYRFSSTFSRNIYETRNMCLLGDPSKGKDQLPFDGGEYSHILWIDDDIIFNIKDIERLFKVDKDIVSGLYLMASGDNYAAVEYWDEEFFNQNGHFRFLSKNDLKNRDSIFTVSYVGFGFLLIKKGVLEQFEYPWFDARYIKIKSSEDFCMEDVAFCLKCKDSNIPIYIDPQIKVTHCKTTYLK
tara:strand:- start:1610 stop:2260 length:651 start_codon:yes stop_codon:yes gene_type:complete